MSTSQVSLLLGVVCLSLCLSLSAGRNPDNRIYMGHPGPNRGYNRDNWKREVDMSEDGPVRQEAAPEMMRQGINSLSDLDYVFGLMPFMKLPSSQSSTVLPAPAAVTTTTTTRAPTTAAPVTPAAPVAPAAPATAPAAPAVPTI